MLFVSQRDDGVHCSYDHKGWPWGLAVALPEEQKAMPIRHSTWPMRALFTSTLLAVAGFAIGYAQQDSSGDYSRQCEPAPGRMDLPHRRNRRPLRHDQGPGLRGHAARRGRHDVQSARRSDASSRSMRRRAGSAGSSIRRSPRHHLRRLCQSRRVDLARRDGAAGCACRRRDLRRDGAVAALRARRARRPAVRRLRRRRHRRSEGGPAHPAVRAAGLLDDLAAGRRQRRRRHRLVDRRQQPPGPGERRGARLRRAHRRAALDVGSDPAGPGGSRVRANGAARSRTRAGARQRVVGARRRPRARSRVRADRQRRARLLRRAAARRQPLRELHRRAARLDRAAWYGRSRRCITISGTTTTPRRRRSSRSRATARAIPAVVQATKTGMLFVLDRETGVPDLPGRGTRRCRRATSRARRPSRTQPFTAVTPPLSPHRFTRDRCVGHHGRRSRGVPRGDRGAAQRGHLHAAEHCRARSSCRRTSAARTGAAWRSIRAADRRRSREPHRRRWCSSSRARVSICERAAAGTDALGDDYEYNMMRGTPYVMRRRCCWRRRGCRARRRRSARWSRSISRPAEPVGGAARLDGVALIPDVAPQRNRLGLPQPRRRHRDSRRRRLHRRRARSPPPRLRHRNRARVVAGELPESAKATPMSYRLASGAQFVAVAVGGGGAWGTGDYVVAFRFPSQ